MNFKEYAEMMRPEIEISMREIVDVYLPSEYLELKQMLAYHLGWEGEGAGLKAQGKRIRPLLVLLSTESAGGKWRQALPAAAAVELLHNFSLIHDDVQDEGEMRRGRPTVWKIWGEAQAINAGDLMFTLSNLAILKLGEMVSPEKALESARIFNETCVQLTKGQYLDMAYEKNQNLTIDAYWPMVSGKTAALLASCAELGAVVAGCDDSRRSIYRQFAYNLGLAFQVWDDWLGVWGDAAIVGKSTDSDLVSGKKSLPILYGLGLRGEFYQRWMQGPINPVDVPVLADLLAKEGAKEYTLREADRLTGEALNALEQIGAANEASTVLRELANLLLNRKH